MEETASMNILDKYEDNDYYSIILRYGLYVSAIFQLVCISASIMLPMFDRQPANLPNSEEMRQRTVETHPNSRRVHKTRKQDKKKRR